MVNIQDRLSATAALEGSLWFKAQILNVWRACPFIDLDIVLDEFETHGAPLCLNERVEVMPGSSPETFLEVPTYDEFEHAESRVLSKALMIFEPIARALGVPGWISAHERDPERFFPNELLQAGLRAMEVQRHQAERDAEGQ